jgi:sarcosine/dimethylglycine N-methyltransferase
MSDAISQTVYFYNRHPISCDIILAKLRAGRGNLDGLRPEDLFPHDQDHYGGIAATDELAQGSGQGSDRSKSTFMTPLRHGVLH